MTLMIYKTAQPRLRLLQHLLSTAKRQRSGGAMAEALKLKADAKAMPSTGFSSFFGSGSSSKHEAARDLYVSAANAFTLEKQFKRAGECHTLAAEMALKLQEDDDAAGDYWNASKAYKKSNPERQSSSFPSVCYVAPVSLVPLPAAI